MRHLNEPPRASFVPRKVREASRAVTEKGAQYATKAGDALDAHLPVEAVKEIVEKVMDGTFELTFKPALKSANAQGALRGYQKAHPEVVTLNDLKKLDLEVLDGFRRRKGLYVSASAVQGGASSLAVTGTVVSTSVTGGVGAPMVVGALAADAVASLATMGRSVGSVAVRYGYDVRLPDEELFAMGVLSLGMAGTFGAKQQALTALSRLSQQMMRRATWKQLDQHVLVKAITRAYQMLGLRLTQRKLGQIVPVVGVALNAALSANMTSGVYQRAEDVYRVRFLSDKYGLDPADWLMGAPVPDEPAGMSPEGVLDVAAILDEERDA